MNMLHFDCRPHLTTLETLSLDGIISNEDLQGEDLRTVGGGREKPKLFSNYHSLEERIVIPKKKNLNFNIQFRYPWSPNSQNLLSTHLGPRAPSQSCLGLLQVILMPPRAQAS